MKIIIKIIAVLAILMSIADKGYGSRKYQRRPRPYVNDYHLENLGRHGPYGRYGPFGMHGPFYRLHKQRPYYEDFRQQLYDSEESSETESEYDSDDDYEEIDWYHYRLNYRRRPSTSWRYRPRITQAPWTNEPTSRTSTSKGTSTSKWHSILSIRPSINEYRTQELTTTPIPSPLLTLLDYATRRGTPLLEETLFSEAASTASETDLPETNFEVNPNNATKIQFNIRPETIPNAKSESLNTATVYEKNVSKIAETESTTARETNMAEPETQNDASQRKITAAPEINLSTQTELTNTPETNLTTKMETNTLELNTTTKPEPLNVASQIKLNTVPEMNLTSEPESRLITTPKTNSTDKLESPSTTVEIEITTAPEIDSTSIPETSSSKLTTTTISPQVISKCIDNCISTSEFNPVCGTDSVTYDNYGKLFCAKSCGVKVELRRPSRCFPVGHFPDDYEDYNSDESDDEYDEYSNYNDEYDGSDNNNKTSTDKNTNRTSADDDKDNNDSRPTVATSLNFSLSLDGDSGQTVATALTLQRSQNEDSNRNRTVATTFTLPPSYDGDNTQTVVTNLTQQRLNEGKNGQTVATTLTLPLLYDEEIGQTVATTLTDQRSHDGDSGQTVATTLTLLPSYDGDSGQTVATTLALPPVHDGEKGQTVATTLTDQRSHDGDSGQTVATTLTLLPSHDGDSGQTVATTLALPPLHDGEKGQTVATTLTDQRSHDEDSNQTVATTLTLPPSPTTTSPRLRRTTALTTLQRCMQLCPPRVHYDPICGTDLVTYMNIERMQCAKGCGKDVQILCNQPCGVCNLEKHIISSMTILSTTSSSTTPLPTTNSLTTKTPKPTVLTTSNSTVGLTVSSNEQCIKSCPIHPEYNPICGTNKVTYRNAVQLLCIQMCGDDVKAMQFGLCPNDISTVTVAPTTTTEAPITSTKVTTNITEAPTTATKVSTTEAPSINTEVSITTVDEEDEELPPEVIECIRRCPVTAEYNPVCGTNDVTYVNPGRLECASYCTIDVKLSYKGLCKGFFSSAGGVTPSWAIIRNSTLITSNLLPTSILTSAPTTTLLPTMSSPINWITSPTTPTTITSS